MNSSPLMNLQQKLEDQVRDEAAACRGWFERFWSMDVADRVEQGRCIAGMEFQKIDDGRILLRVADNQSDFREGDLVRLSRGSPRGALLVGASIYRIEDDAVWLQTAQDLESRLPDLERGQWTLDPDFLDLESVYRGAMLDLKNTERGRERILPLLSDEMQPEFDFEDFTEAEDRAAQSGANDSQAEAIAAAVATDLCHLVQGPPGTGKTYALAQIVRERWARGERVLVTAFTHRAIHNALNMIAKVAPEITAIAKIGRPVHDPGLRVPQFEFFHGSPLAECEGALVVGATPFALRSQALRGVEFDAVIVDEASQVTLPLAVMAMLSADCYILIGDEKQLPPVLQSVPLEEAEGRSIFAHLRGRSFCTMLETTYRMNDALTRWPSESFYSGGLHAAPANASRRLALPQPPGNYADILAPSQPLTLVELDHAEARNFSIDEATLAAGLLETLHGAGLPLEAVAVVVPFRRQARLIRSLLAKKLALREVDCRACVIDTVERMQGQERDVVIVSMTASEPDYLRAIAKFLLRPQRLNVAVTRARTKVIVLASAQLAELETFDPDDAELVEVWRTLRAAATVIHC